MSNKAVVFLDTRPKGFPDFDAYFRYATKMRMAPHHADLVIEKTTFLGNMCLTDLALAMARNLSTGQNAVIYTHAEPNNFVFPIDFTKPKNDFDVKEAANLSYHLDLLSDYYNYGNQLGKGAIVDPFVAEPYRGYVNPFHKTNFLDKSPDYLKINKDYAESLMDNCLAVRKLKLEHLAIRACRVGQNKDFMRFLGLLFGAKTVSAPVLRTASVLGKATAVRSLTPEASKKLAALLEKSGRGFGGTYVGGTHIYKYENWCYGGPPMYFTFRYQKTGKTSFNLTEVLASQDEAAYDFLRKTAGYDAPITQVINSNVFALHALQGPDHLIFPGEKEYLQNMTFVTV